ncbi:MULTISPECIES: SPOR domain-containing protein [Winogradskyella]|uniref:SPOR domain-containing protein n=1 Tax=Winogradskyella marincola TaxID=3037795 RepID=A0ABT6FYR2_9FLAO|nr:SPOR domain-containing protein [Winogradskyella sp. YYF002]MDG4714924.1 SPOR domain-containing protein [Winogradskyella sp. YYF002]
MTKKNKYISTAILTLLLSASLNAQQGDVTIEQDKEIDKLLEYKKDVKTSKVYRIQIFQSTDPDKADREKLNFLNLFDEWPAEIVWNTPNYKIWVGNFTTRLEADRALAKIKKEYMYAMIFQPKSDKK